MFRHLFILSLSFLSGIAFGTINLSTNGKANAIIVLPAEHTLPEQTAANELAAYLGKVTGGKFVVVAEPEAPRKGICIYVGPTKFAKAHKLDVTALGPEEWVIRTFKQHLLLCGGRPRGTLYAVYRFLEDEVGVRWWNPFEESVPKKPTLTLGKLNRHGKPVFRYRDIYMLYGNDSGRFAARNRLNRQGDTPIAKEYGGSLDYGPPYHVHTFFLYIPPEKYFEQHPEWFSLIQGKRSADHTQLCLTNQELRQVFVEKLTAYIEESRVAAQKAGLPPPTVFDISQNDWGGQCQCDKCQAIAKAEDSEAGPLLDFINFVADAIKDKYPEVYIDTLAYMHTQKAPKTIKPRDNVIIRLCDTQSNFTRSITDPENAQFREHLVSWAKIAKNLRIWDYAVTYAPYYGLPLPTVHTYPVDYRFYAQHNVEGVFTEHEYPILADLRDFKIWMMIKLLEDPYRNYNALVKDFTDGFYGPAGRMVREYLNKLEAASAAKISYLSMGASPRQYRYLDLKFVQAAHRIFDRAEAAVGNNPVLLRRLRHARLPLDRATVVLFPKLMEEWIAAGNTPESMPLNRDGIAQRYKATWYEQIDLRLPEDQRAAERARAEAEITALTMRPAFVPLPEKFRNLPPGTVFDYTADTSRNWQNIVKVVPDNEAESGITNRLELSDEDIKKYQLPMPWGLYDQINKKHEGAVIKPEDVPGPGYHWYNMGTFNIKPSHYVYFFWSWIIQLDIDDVVDPKHPDQRFEVWARIKFEGPGFPYGNPDAKNAIAVERVVLVKSR